MTMLSSPRTMLIKRVVPILGFGFLGLYFVAAMTIFVTDDNLQLLAPGERGNPPFIVFLAMPLAMAVPMYFAIRHFVFTLADEVVDLGDALRIRRDGDEARIALKDFAGARLSTLSNPPRALLALRHARDPFGQKIFFLPAGRTRRGRSHPLVDALDARIRAAKS